MMIGFVGAGSTGKTSVAEALAADPEVGEEYFPSIVRATMARFGVTEKTSLNLTLQQMKDLQYAIFDAKINQDEHRRGIYDRTPIDQLSYCITRCYNKIADSEYLRLLNACQTGMQRYDCIAYFPPYDQIAYSDDGFRATGKAWRDLQAHTMVGYLNMMRINYFTVPMCTVEERVSIIKARINMVKKL